MVFRHLGIADDGQGRSLRWTVPLIDRIQLRIDRCRDGEDPGELFQLTLRTRFSAQQFVARPLGSRRREECFWCFSDRVRYNFVTSGRAGSGLSDDFAWLDNAGYTRQAAARSPDHKTAVDTFGDQ